MDSNPSVKRLQNEGIDRISDLPDSILGKILSYLPTRYAVATSILSTRWRTLFPFAVPLIRLDLVDTRVLFTQAQSFIDYVDKLLNVDLRDVTCVERVVFFCTNDYADDKIVSWVCAALRLNVKHLRFTSSLDDFKVLFGSLNGCTTLVELDLGHGVELRLPETFILPNLNRLLLRSLTFSDDMDSISDLLDGCPVLKDLSILGCRLSHLDTVNIRHPILNMLFIDGSFNDIRCQVVIDAPNLIALALKGNYVADYVLMNTKSLHSVCIDYNHLSVTDTVHFSSYLLCKLVRACSSTTRLRLTGHSVEDLWYLFSCVSVPTFQNLTCLALGHMGIHGWDFLVQFLENAPNLAILTFEEGLGTFGMSLLPREPVCLELHVKKIEIWGFKWSQDKIKLIEFFLTNGRVLEELIVYSVPQERASNFEKLSMLPRHSKACQILVKDRSNLGTSCYSRESWFHTGRA